jgi:hypothetical protein
MQLEQSKSAIVAARTGGKNQCEDERKSLFFTITTATELTAEVS